MNYGEWMAESIGQPTWRTVIRQDVDEAIASALTWRQFVRAMEQQGYELRMLRKHPTLKPPGKDRPVRFKTLGQRYTPEALQMRILYARHKSPAGGPPKAGVQQRYAVFAAAVLKDQKKMHGRTNLTRLLRDGKPLKFFVVPEERMKEFAVEANARGLLFVPVKDKTKEDGKIEIAVWAEDAAKVNRALEKMKLDYVQADTGSKADVVTAISEKVIH